MFKRTWQIWSNGTTEDTTLPADSVQHAILTKDVDGVQMKLLHTYEIVGTDELDNTKKAFAYSKQWRFGVSH